MISISSELKDALSGRNFTYAWLVELPDNLRYTTHSDDVIIGGATYIASGHILSIPGISRSKGIKVQDLNITLAASDGAFEALFKSRNMTGEPCAIKLALIDDSGAVISGEAIGIYKGQFDSWSLSDNGSRETITISISSAWSKPLKTAGRLTNPSDQQARYPGDKFFDFAHENKKHLGWGGEV